MIRAIFAIDEQGGMGRNGSLPWPHNKDDMRWFKSCTVNNTIIMGRKTWDSFKSPLPDRESIVVTTQPINSGITTLSGDINAGILKLQQNNPEKYFWIIGGPGILMQTQVIIHEVYLTRIPGIYEVDVKLDTNQFLEPFSLQSETVYPTCIIQKYQRRV